ncbi:MAG: DNA replication protein DnaC [Tissierella sp.]
MDGDQMDYKEFIRESIAKNDAEVREGLLEEKRRKIQELSKNNGLPKLFKKKTFDNYNSNNNLRAFNTTKEFVNNFPNSKGLLLTGTVGTGKTHLASAITNALTEELYSVYFGNVVDIMSFIKSTYSGNSILTEDEAIKLMTESVDLLVIDDLGKENSTENTLVLLYQIINRLYENEKPVIITTNYNAADLSKKLGERGRAMVSRISNMCTPIVLNGEDWRLKK